MGGTLSTWKLLSISPLCTAPLGQWFFGRETNQETKPSMPELEGTYTDVFKSYFA